jgi:hypothetical protein
MDKASMSEVSIIGLDIAKNVFHAHGADALGGTVFSRRIARGKLLAFFASKPRCLVALEACGGVAGTNESEAVAAPEPGDYSATILTNRLDRLRFSLRGP